MSKNITIQEGGVAKQLTVDKLKTNVVGGGTMLWVPEEDVQLTTKTITEDGTYKAVDDGYYGYSEVTVNGIGKATGIDADGDEATVSVNSGGALVEEKIPSFISVVTPPTVTTYADGATIDFTGMVVKAYLNSGELWSDALHPGGVIPIDELILPVTQADAGGVTSDEWSDGSGVVATMVWYTLHQWVIIHSPQRIETKQAYLSQAIGTYNGNPALWGDTSGPTSFFATIYDGKLYVWNGTAVRALTGYEDTGNVSGRYSVFSGSSWRSTNEVSEYQLGSYDSWITGIAHSSVAPTGNEQMRPDGAYQVIPVQWTRPGDYHTLESSFNITVT